jgi:anaerobic selenocysteine-containing dehydrogenase
VDVLNVLTGNLDQPGGAMFPRPWHEDRSGRPPARFGRFHSRVGGHPEVLGEFPVAALVEEITTPGPGQVRALFCVAGNPVLSTPDGPALDAALGDLDLMVAVDPYVTATSRRAHVILPPPPPRHSGHADLAFSGLAVRNVLQYTPPVVPLPAGRPSEEEILLRLAAIAQGAGPPWTSRQWMTWSQRAWPASWSADPRRGPETAMPQALLEAVAPRRGAERLIDLLLRSGPLRRRLRGRSRRLVAGPAGTAPARRGPGTAGTPGAWCAHHDSGRIELAPPAILDDVARLQALPDALSDDALLLVGRRHLRTNNSWGQNVPSLQGTRDLCVLFLHPDDALAAGVKDGQDVGVTSSTGQVVVSVEVTDDIRPGVVSLPHGFGQDLDGIELTVASSRPGANVNRLVGRATLDPLSGTSGLSGVPVEVAPA